MKVIFALVSALSLIILCFWYFLRTPDAFLPEQEPTNFPSITTEDEVIITLPSGKITFTRPEKLKHAVEVDKNLWHFEGTEQDQDAGFGIIYNADNQSFAVDLWKKPLNVTHESASKYLLDILETSESEICQLNIYVGVTYDVDPALSGKNLKLSFCPDAVQL